MFGIGISKRALRRHHYRRLQAKRKNYWFGNHTPRESGMIATTPHPCSCLGCGNLRKHCNQKTVQERRYENAEED